MSTLSKAIPANASAFLARWKTNTVTATVTATKGWGGPNDTTSKITIAVPEAVQKYFNRNVIVKWQRCGRLLILRDCDGLWLRRAENVGDQCFGVSLTYYLYGFKHLRRAAGVEPFNLDYTLPSFSTKRMVEMAESHIKWQPDIAFDRIQRFPAQEIESEEDPHSCISKGIFFHEMEKRRPGPRSSLYSIETTPVTKVPTTRNMPKRNTVDTIAVYTGEADDTEERLDDLENAMVEMVESNDTVTIRGIEFSITDARKLLGIA
tara:strand:+ start:32005 stop:32793 length:789 start_codon:yes stop_codon:yes gene_type:complete